MNKIIFLAPLLLTACQPAATELPVHNHYAASSLQEISHDRPAVSEYLISARGIGEAQLGMTLGQLKKIVDRHTDFKLISNFASDLNAIAVSKRGLIHYYILFAADAKSSAKFNPPNNAEIVSLMTNNYSYQTEEGIKVGMSIQEAEDTHGNAILSYNLGGTSKEYIAFNNYDADNVRFRASSSPLIANGTSFSGIYAQYPGVAHTTDKFRADAAIAMIEVSCPQNVCQD
ncbi:MAG: hypothetical protein AAFQ41_09500 [Cyanobacteria bacterium J06623_7]